LDLASDLVHPASCATHPVHVAYVFGSANAGEAGEVFHVEAGPWNCRLGSRTGAGVVGAHPFGALLAGVAIGAESLRLALRLIAARTNARTLLEHDLARPAGVFLELPALPTRPLDLGAIDIISAGAITNAALFALFRWPGLRARLRTIDADIATESNLNRYALLRRGALHQKKVVALSSYATPNITIESVDDRFDETSLSNLLPLSARVLVGVDDIPSRWLVSRHAPGWYSVAGTTHFTVMVSDHDPKGPCGGCLHPVDDADDEPIPTVSFVSGLAGLLQAYRVLAHGYGLASEPVVLAAPFNLGAPRALAYIGIAPRRDCPNACVASRAMFNPDRGASRCASLTLFPESSLTHGGNEPIPIRTARSLL